MVGLKVSTLGPQIGENCSFSPLKFYGSTHEHPPIENNQFQNIRRRVVKFRENRFSGLEKSVDRKINNASKT